MNKMNQRTVTLGQAIKYFRTRKKGMSLRAVARECEISHEYLNQIERDNSEPSQDLIRSLGISLGVDPEWLMLLSGIIPDTFKETIRQNPKDVLNFLEKLGEEGNK
ncbi:MAG: helix-turn-helix transcriptional regulator [bacterium]|nr:helix-turn-helix transcriptional regulator [bacterium]